MKATRKLAMPFLTALTIVVTGCTSIQGGSYSSINKLSTLQVTAPSLLEIISQETQKAMNAQLSLTKYRQTYNETLGAYNLDFSKDKIRVNYIGKPQGILESIAIKYGYRFLEQGYRTDNLPTVNFTDYNATPEDIVIAVDSQLQQTANIAIDKQNKTIVLIYK